MKKYLFPIVSFLITIGCFVGSALGGSEVGPYGFLNEPYFILIPIGYFFLFLSIISTIVISIISYFRKRSMN